MTARATRFGGGWTRVDGTETEIKFEPDVSLTWVINESFSDAPTWPGFRVKFTSNDTAYVRLVKIGLRLSYYHIVNGTTESAQVVHNGTSWINDAYRTVTFEEAPTGDLLTWLQANAVQQ